VLYSKNNDNSIKKINNRFFTMLDFLEISSFIMRNIAIIFLIIMLSNIDIALFVIILIFDLSCLLSKKENLKEIIQIFDSEISDNNTFSIFELNHSISSEPIQSIISLFDKKFNILFVHIIINSQSFSVQSEINEKSFLFSAFSVISIISKLLFTK